MATLSAVRTDVQYRITDATGKFWSATMLNLWINQAMKDIARRAEILETTDDIAVSAGDRQYDLPLDIFRIHRVEFVISSSNIYVLEPRDIHEMDAIWGVNQTQQMSFPSYYTTWGIMGIDCQIYLYPSPSQAGTLKVWSYRLPATVANDGDVCEVPVGWEDLIPLYCEYIALRRDNDPRWEDAKSIYEQEMANLVDMTRSHHDQAHWITSPAMNQAPWLGGQWGGGW